MRATRWTRWWASLTLFALADASLIAVASGSNPGLLWATPALLFVLVPLMDAVAGKYEQDHRSEMVQKLRVSRPHDLLLWLSLPMQFVAFGLGVFVAATRSLDDVHVAGLVMTVGAVNGLGIVVAHEIGHRKTKTCSWLARVGLAPSMYGHFLVEHTRGHHRNVATPRDPASARMGETYWAFLARSVIGGIASAWRIERERLARQGKHTYSPDNLLLQAWAASATLLSLVYVVSGVFGVVFMLAQAAYAISLLEVVNYIEHYGLLRRTDDRGRFEPCGLQHSWNSDHIVSNLLLFHLPRHSDHHARPWVHYQALRSNTRSPQLPYGYATMLLTAYLPPLWFAVMDRRVIAHYGGDVTQANRAQRRLC